MRNVIGTGAIICLLTACGMNGMKKNLEDAAALQKKFPSDNISVNTSYSTGDQGVTHTLEVTNLHEGLYSDISLGRQTSCIGYEYYNIIADSLRDALNLTVEMKTSSKDGIVTTSNSESNSYSGSDLRKIDSAYAFVLDYLDMVRANRSFGQLYEYVDTAYVPDAAFTEIDTMALVINSQTPVDCMFYGLVQTTLEDLGKEVAVIWIYVSNETKYQVLRFILDADTGMIIGMSINPDL